MSSGGAQFEEKSDGSAKWLENVRLGTGDNDLMALLEGAIAETVALAAQFFPVSAALTGARTVEAMRLVNMGVQMVLSTFGEREALDWAGDYKLDDKYVKEGLQLYKESGGDLTIMAEKRWTERLPTRLNSDRVKNTLSPKNPDFERVMELATVGMTVFVDPSFISNVGAGHVPPLRQTYRRLAPVIDRLVAESLLEKGLGVILPKAVALKIEGVQLSLSSWTPKVGKEKGRLIGDCADGGKNQTPLNSKWVKEFSDGHWGQIHHPSIGDIVRMITTFRDECVSAGMLEDDVVKQLVLYKMDLAGAFTLLSFRPEDVRLMGFEMSEELVLFYLVGIFGWTGTPAAFQVITRALIFELRRLVEGQLTMYVDDAIAVCLSKQLSSNIFKCDAVFTNLLGPEAVAHAKTESGRMIDAIGFSINLITWRVSVSEKNLARALVGFLRAAPDGMTHRREMERLASWSSRYGEINLYIKSVTRLLYSSYIGRKEGVKFKLKPQEWRALRVVRMLLAMTAGDSTIFSRPIDSFREKTAAVVVEFDASLSGVGVVWYAVDKAGCESPLGALSVDIRSMGFGSDTQYQNVAEFIGGIVGVLGVIMLGLGLSSIRFRGDSKSALCWLTSRKFKGDRTANAAIVLMVLVVQHGLSVLEESEFLSSEQNGRADKLSRGWSVTKVADYYDDLRGIKEVMLPVGQMTQVLMDCHPGTVITSDEELAALWKRVQGYSMMR